MTPMDEVFLAEARKVSDAIEEAVRVEREAHALRDRFFSGGPAKAWARIRRMRGLYVELKAAGRTADAELASAFSGWHLGDGPDAAAAPQPDA